MKGAKTISTATSKTFQDDCYTRGTRYVPNTDMCPSGIEDSAEAIQDFHESRNELHAGAGDHRAQNIPFGSEAVALSTFSTDAERLEILARDLLQRNIFTEGAYSSAQCAATRTSHT